MNKKAYISPVVRAVRVSTTEMLLAYSNPDVRIGGGQEDPDNFDTKGDRSAGGAWDIWNE